MKIIDIKVGRQLIMTSPKHTNWIKNDREIDILRNSRKLLSIREKITTFILILHLKV